MHLNMETWLNWQKHFSAKEEPGNRHVRSRLTVSARMYLMGTFNKNNNGNIAQSVERLSVKQRVAGSSPAVPALNQGMVRSHNLYASFVQWRGQRISNPPIRVRFLYEDLMSTYCETKPYG